MKKVIQIISVFLITIIFFLSGNVLASEASIDITGLSVDSKTDNVTVGNIGFDESKITTNAILSKKDDYVTYKITIKNKDKVDYKIENIADDNASNYVKTSYKKDSVIESGKTANIYMTLKLEKLVDDISLLDADDYYNLDEMNISLILSDYEGNTVTATITNNPNTGDNIILYIALLILSIVSIAFILFIFHKNKKVIHYVAAILVFALAIPTFASKQYNLKFLLENNNIKVKVNTYTITRKDTDEEIKNISNQDYILDLEEPSKNGYTFEGWTTDENSDEVEYVNGDIINTDEDLNFYPVFNVIIYNISYDITTETDPIQLPKTYTVEDDVTIPNLTKYGYTFKGWTGSNGNELQLNLKINKGTTGDKEYKAYFDLTQYDVALNTGDGTNHTSYNINMENQLNISDPTRDGYIFKGWSYEDDSTPEITSNPTSLDISKSNGDVINLYAVWEKINITINTNDDLNDFVAGNSINLTAIVSPSNLQDQVTWSVNNNKATVDQNGKVKANSEGDIVVTASVGGAVATKTINIKKAIAYRPETGRYYSSLRKGIDSVSPTASTDTEKTVELIANTSEVLNVKAARNVIVDFKTHTLTGKFTVESGCYANLHGGTINGTLDAALWVEGKAVVENMSLNAHWGIMASDSDTTGKNLQSGGVFYPVGSAAYNSAIENRATVWATNCTISGDWFDTEVRRESTIYLNDCTVSGQNHKYQIPNDNEDYSINGIAGRIYVGGVAQDGTE